VKLVQWALKSPRLLYSRRFRRTQLSKGVAHLFRRVHRKVEYYGIEDGDTLILAFARDKFITRALLEDGSYQRGELSLASELLRREGHALGGCFLDVGANIGTHTVYALRSNLFSRAVSIEPEPNNNRLLRANVFLNGYQNQVTTFCAAAGEREGVVPFELSWDNFGDHRISATSARPEEREQFKESRRKRIEVRLAPLDSLVSEARLEPSEISLMWVDTQGFEAFVLAGAKKTLEAGPPVVMEVWPYALQRSGGFDLLPRLISENFVCYYDLAEGLSGRRQPAKDVGNLLERLRLSNGTTDLLLISGSRLAARSAPAVRSVM
jgi:FkbM family methyltransferase